MEGQTAFDFRSHAEKALKAQLAYKHFLDEAYKKLHTDRNLKALGELRDLRNSSEYHRVWEEYIAAVDAAYPPDFDEDFVRLRGRTDLKALETAVAFLEADPFFDRTGYMKEKLLRYVRGYQLTPAYVDRLQQVILNVVDDHYCREFREYCRL